MMRILFSLLLWSASAGLLAQKTSIIEDFTAVQLGDGIELNWKIGRGNSCINMEIQRSIDTLQWEQVGLFQGVCGSDDADTYYDYYDQGPLQNNQTYFYRIYASAGTVISTVRQIDFFNQPLNTIRIIPNPASGPVTIFFSNRNQQQGTVTIYDMNGKRVYEEWSRDNFVTLDAGNLAAGIYVVRLSMPGAETVIERLLVGSSAHSALSR